MLALITVRHYEIEELGEKKKTLRQITPLANGLKIMFGTNSKQYLISDNKNNIQYQSNIFFITFDSAS
jgi:hypothetical protein